MRKFDLTCTIPRWAYDAHGETPTSPDGARYSFNATCLTTEEFREQRPKEWVELDSYLSQFRGPDYGYETESDWRGDVCVNPMADPDECRWFVRHDGVVFWKWRHDAHSHGESFYVPGTGWMDSDEAYELRLWGYEDEEVGG